MDDLKKQLGTSSMLHQALYIISKPSVNSNRSYNPETLNSGQNWQFFVPCDLESWWMTLKNNRTPLLCYFKLCHCASFRSHRSIQTGVIVWKRPILGKIWRFFALCHLEIWRITLKNNRAPLLCYFKFCASLFLAIWAIQTVQKWQINVKNNIFLSCVTLKFDGWPWKTTGHLYFKLCASFHSHRSNWSYSPEKPNSGQNWRFFVPCDLGILAFDLEKQ